MTTTSEYHCGNCPNNKTKDHSDEVKHGFVGKGSRYVDDDLVWCNIPDRYEGHWIEPTYSEERGCLSHPSAQAALRAEVLNDFAEWVDKLVSDGWIVKRLVKNYNKEKNKLRVKKK